MNGPPELKILIQPVNKVRFRYASEAGSHGGLQGQCRGNMSSENTKTYPTIKLENFHDWESVKIRASLYTTDKRNKHVLEFKGRNCKDGMCYENLKEDFTATFRSLSITSQKKEMAFNILLEQKIREKGLMPNPQNKRLLKDQLKSQIQKEIKDNSTSVRICFEAFVENCSTSLTQPVFSQVIHNQKAAVCGDLKIHRMSQCAGTWKGGDEIILLCDKIQKENVEIKFFEIEGDNVIWSDTGKFTKADVHYQVAITFRTPPYRENAEKNVYVCLARKDEESSAIEFKYISTCDDIPKKRKKPDPSLSYEEISLSDPSLNMDTNEIDEECAGENLSNFIADFDAEYTLISLGFETVNEESNFYGTFVDGVMPSRGMAAIPKPMIPIKTEERVAYGEMADPVFPNKHGEKTSKEPNEETSSGNAKVLDDNSSSTPESKWDKFKRILSARDKNRNNFLHICIEKRKNIANVLKISKVLSCDLVNEQNIKKETPLHTAVRMNAASELQELLQSGGNPLICDIHGNNCFHIAVENESLDCFSLLTTQGHFLSAAINMFNFEGLTPLHLAVIRNATTCFNILCKRPDINIKEKKRGRTPLHLAVQYNSPLLRTILEYGEVNVNAQDFEGNTPLHIACAAGALNIVKQLLKANTDPTIKNFKKDMEEKGETPMDFASDYPEVLKLLKEHLLSRENVNMEQKLCKILDPPSTKWRDVGMYLGMEEAELAGIISYASSPTHELLSYMHKQYPDDCIERLSQILQLMGVKDALEVIQTIKQ